MIDTLHTTKNNLCIRGLKKDSLKITPNYGINQTFEIPHEVKFK